MTSGAPMELVMYRPDEAVFERLGLPRIDIPVRRQNARDIFKSGGVDLDLLAVELDVVVGNDSHLSALYGPTIARLADLAAARHAIDGRLDAAEKMCRVGLRHRPAYVGLNLKLAVALQAMGRHRQSAKHYDIALARLVTVDPIVLVMAARAHASAGDLDRALDLLERCPEEMLDDPGFSDLYQTYAAAAVSGSS